MARPKKIKSPLELIKNGILGSNWSLVVDGYAALTGETLDIPRKDEVSDSQRKLEEILNILGNIGSEPTKASVDEEEEGPLDPEVEVATATKKPLKQPTIPNVAEAVRARTPRLVTNHIVATKKEAKQIKQHIRSDKEFRPAKPKLMKNCSACNNKFDFNKAYPANKLDNGTKIFLCDKCQARGM